jgi:hypothetical protein
MTITATQLLAAVLSGSLIGGVISYYKTSRMRRKQVVAEAFETALARVELLYKVRRRTKDKNLLPQDELAIRNEIHLVQQKTDYYIGILNAESAWYGERYERLVRLVKIATEDLLRAAWKEEPQGVGVELKDAKHPQLVTARKNFIRDTRRYFNPLKRLFFASVYRLFRLVDGNE